MDYTKAELIEELHLAQREISVMTVADASALLKAAAANAVIARLPKYVDTGESIAPGMVLWVITDDAGVQGDIAGPIHCLDYDGHEARGCYSTEAAAEAAKEKE